MERYIEIDGHQRLFKASGATPRIYRGICGRDLLIDFLKLETAGDFTPELLEVYEDLAYTMAKQGNDSLPNHKEFPGTPDEWLDTIECLDIYDILPQIADMWRESNKTIVKSKKKTE